MPKCTQIIIIFMVSIFGQGSIGCWSGNARVQDDSDAADAGMEQMNSMMLEIASTAALRTGYLEDAGFLFLVSQARFQIDKVVYPPLGKGGDSPDVLKAAMSAMLGPSMLKNLADQPDVFLKVIARLEAWSPEFAADYDPGWKYEGKLVFGDN